MSYVRSKNIKGHTYYYLVSSKRVNGHVVQKFEKYYGKSQQEPRQKKETEAVEKHEEQKHESQN